MTSTRTTTSTTLRRHYWQRRPRGRVLPVAVAVVGLIAVVAVQSVPNRHTIEGKLTDRSTRALAAAGLSTVDVHFTGRDGRLRARTAAEADRALAIVRAQEGVRVATAEVAAKVNGSTRQPAVTLTLDAGKVVLTGTVPSAAARAGLVDAARTAVGAGTVDDRLSVDAAVGDTGLGGLGAVLAALGKDPTGAAVDLRDGTITLTGTVPAQSNRDAAVQAATRAVGKPSAVVDRLSVAAPPPPPTQIQTRLTALPRITFENRSATLTPQGRAIVVQVADILKANPTVRVRIEGHTDSNGSAAANLALSQARAQTVFSTLVSLGVVADRMTTAGFGESRPEVPDTTPANQAINRRVAFVVLP
jgi:outer membrane protein OmpA-like peptidoglycan-associated protein